MSGLHLRAGLLCLTFVCAAVTTAPVSAEVAEEGSTQPRRVAVVVGANQAAPGRKPLRFSHDDARSFARVLQEVAGVAPRDVSVLLDPEPEAVLRSLDAQLARLSGHEGLLIFYYSGHADAQALYPHGRPLLLSALQKRLADPRVSVRIGVIDACRGGAFTGAKGLSETEPFSVDLPHALQSEGSVLIASSSGLEDAHESEALHGSFFTHHWNAALRGAGDGNGDGQVTVGEAFDYAKAYTIRDTSLYTAAAQHPSFSMQLRGRQDLPLARIPTTGALLAVTQQKGPLQLVHLDSGVVVLELPKGARKAQLVLMPGRYLVRRLSDTRVWGRELTIRSGARAAVSEAELSPLASPLLAEKRAAPRPLTLSTLPAHTHEISFGFGVHHSPDAQRGVTLGGDRSVQGYFLAPWGITDRLQWVVPTLSLVYRGGAFGGLEWLPWGGITSWGFGAGNVEGLILKGSPEAGIDLRRWLGPRSSVDFSLAFSSGFFYRSKSAPERPFLQSGEHFAPPTTWRARFSVGYTRTIADVVTLHVALAVGETWLYKGELANFALHSMKSNLSLGLGSVQDIGLRRQPLVRVHLSDHLALNFDAAITHYFGSKATHESYLVGTSFFF